MKKKIISTTLIIILITCSVFATTLLGTLTYWYSNGSSIGYWTTARKINLNSDNSTATTAAQNAATQWTNAGVSSSWVSTGNNMFMFCYPYDECIELNDSIDLSMAGFTESYRSFVGYFDYDGVNKSGYEVYYAECYVITDVSTNYVQTSAHELGHAFGWEGHSTSSSDIMYTYENSITTLTSRDKNHLNQVY